MIDSNLLFFLPLHTACILLLQLTFFVNRMLSLVSVAVLHLLELSTKRRLLHIYVDKRKLDWLVGCFED